MSEVTLEISSAVATITLRRAHRHNTLVPSFLSELRDAFRRAGSAPGVAAVVLSAEGSTFSTGGDVRAFWDHRDDSEPYARETVGGLHALMVDMMRLPHPIVVGVGGMVTGGSLGLVLASDVVIVSPEATFTPWYSVVGFSPDGGWTALLPHMIGRARVADVLHTNRTITAEESVAWGLASRLVAPADLDAAAQTLALEIAGFRHGSQRSIKRLLGGDIDDAEVRLAVEEERFVTQIATDEARQGMARFLGIEA